jgi:hypothetical protein
MPKSLLKREHVTKERNSETNLSLECIVHKQIGFEEIGLHWRSEFGSSQAGLQIDDLA